MANRKSGLIPAFKAVNCGHPRKTGWHRGKDSDWEARRRQAAPNMTRADELRAIQRFLEEKQVLQIVVGPFGWTQERVWRNDSGTKAG